MRRHVRWEHAAVEDLLELAIRDRRLGRRILMAIRAFEGGERTDFKKLTGLEHWRIRSGDWRIVLSLYGAEAYIEPIDNRRDAY